MKSAPWQFKSALRFSQCCTLQIRAVLSIRLFPPNKRGGGTYPHLVPKCWVPVGSLAALGAPRPSIDEVAPK